MDIKPFLGAPEPLESWIKKCISSRGLGSWLVYEDTPQNADLALSTKMFPIVGDTGQLSDEEFDEFEDSLINNGYCYLLNLDQIEDVIDNYTFQKPHPTDREIVEAIAFYYENDAFICL
ncbi:DUF7716 domain-containing protein [Marinobacter zhejiangensis]|uniref:DUF7716 domain-containing protein n=1 Tax=Marinobacter zhejiangensis TaxID=488535 RepID=A0A1I4QAU4_9GAMM|nr:hypothetical protein [Marinobacter zhejiangensis]SFM37208.1 hypothetical protein SAMN04487963_2285 [Marinobacter zhejiangensis]